MEDVFEITCEESAEVEKIARIRYSRAREYQSSAPCTLPPNMHHRIGQRYNYVIKRTLAYCRGTDARQ